MRGKWVLGAGAVLALVVVGGVGGLTMRALAGVAHTKVTTKTVTKFCVYVDRTSSGNSYGDVSVVPKYKHRTCIVGKRGPAGSSSVVTWNKTVANGSTTAAKRKRGGVPSGAIDLAKVGPFTIRGYCTSTEGTQAVTDVISGQDGSSFTWQGSSAAGSFNSGDDMTASYSASGSSGSPDFVNEDDAGDFSASTADNKTSFTGAANNGVYMNGASGPACSFSGYVVVEK